MPESLVWPKPPAPARIRFVKSVETPADWGVSGGAFQQFIDKMTGQTPFRFVRPTGVAVRGSALYVADAGAQALVILDPAEGHEHKITRVGRTTWCRRSRWRSGRRTGCSSSTAHCARSSSSTGRGSYCRPSAARASWRARPASPTTRRRSTVRRRRGGAPHLRLLGRRPPARLVRQQRQRAGRIQFPDASRADANGDLLVTDTLNFRVQVLRRNGKPLASFGRVGDGSGNFASPKGVGADSDGNIYVVDALFDAVQVFARRDAAARLRPARHAARAGSGFPTAYSSTRRTPSTSPTRTTSASPCSSARCPPERTAMTARNDPA